MERRSWLGPLLLAVVVLLAANLVVMTTGGQRPAQAAAAKQFRYKIMVIGDLTSLEQRMNEAGAQGWEFRAYAPGDTNQGTVAFLVLGR